MNIFKNITHNVRILISNYFGIDLKFLKKNIYKNLEKPDIDIKKFNHWIIDVQGAELDVLKGSIDSLKLCKSIVVEISTEVVEISTEKFYENGSIFYDVKKLLNSLNFVNIKEPTRNHQDILFIKNK